MALNLSPKTQARITEMVEHGDYPDADTMLDQALELLSERERLARLREMIAIGVEQAQRGDVVPYDDAFRREARLRARQRIANGEKPSSDVCP